MVFYQFVTDRQTDRQTDSLGAFCAVVHVFHFGMLCILISIKLQYICQGKFSGLYVILFARLLAMSQY